METSRLLPWRHAVAAAWLGVTVAMLASSTDAGATVLCAAFNRTTGTLREGATLKVRTTCKASEQQVDPAAIGIQGLSKLTVRTGNTVSTNGGLATSALCQQGEVATGGGALTSVSGGAEITVRSSRPQPDTAGSVPTSWRINASNLNSAGMITATAYAVCAAP